jgi:hypothetical protein
MARRYPTRRLSCSRLRQTALQQNRIQLRNRILSHRSHWRINTPARSKTGSGWSIICTYLWNRRDKWRRQGEALDRAATRRRTVRYMVRCAPGYPLFPLAAPLISVPTSLLIPLLSCLH